MTDPNKIIKAQYQSIDLFQTTIVKNDNLIFSKSQVFEANDSSSAILLHQRTNDTGEQFMVDENDVLYTDQIDQIYKTNLRICGYLKNGMDYNGHRSLDG